VNIQGKRHYLWRAVDQDGDVIDILVQRYRNAHAAKRFFRKLLKVQGAAPWRLVTDRLRSYSAAHRQVMPSVTHDTRQYANTYQAPGVKCADECCDVGFRRPVGFREGSVVGL
jgi:putative transposase